MLLALVVVGGAVGATSAGLVGVSSRVADADATAASTDDATQSKSAAPLAATVDDDDVITIRGKVVTPDGQAAVDVPLYVLRWYWNYGERKPLAVTRSDGNGRFEISYRKSQFAESAGRPNQWRETYIAAFADGYGPGWAHYDRLKRGEQPTITLARDDVPIEGRVIDLEGNPVVGAKIEVGTISEPRGRQFGRIRCSDRGSAGNFNCVWRYGREPAASRSGALAKGGNR